MSHSAAQESLTPLWVVHVQLGDRPSNSRRLSKHALAAHHVYGGGGVIAVYCTNGIFVSLLKMLAYISC